MKLKLKTTPFTIRRGYFTIVMKVFVFLCCFSAFSIVPDGVMSQSAKVDIDANKELTVDEVFDLIMDQTDYRFVYQEGIFENYPKVKVKKGVVSANKLLQKSLSNGNFKVVIANNNSILVEVVPETSDEEERQDTIVSGTVTDEDGQLLPGASVLEKGTTNGTNTDFDGNFELEVSDLNATLVVSYLGFATQEIALLGQTNISVVLIEDTAGLDEVVVIGYGTARKADLTGAVSSLTVADTDRAPNVSITEALQGRLPGLNVGQVDEAGGNGTLSVRGQSTVGGNTSPLIVVDDIIFNGDLSELNPLDIATIDVLKDPSSKAIFGAQAANGVILITSKKGKFTGSGKPVIRYSTSYAAISPSNLLSTYDREGFQQKARDIIWFEGYTEESGFTAPNPAFDPLQAIIEQGAGPLTNEGIENGTDFDWYDALTHDGFIEKHDVSVTGNSENTRYLISAGYLNQKGFMLNDEFSRVTSRINLETDINDWLKLGVNSYIALADYSGEDVLFREAAIMSPFFTPFDEDGSVRQRLEVFQNPLATTRNPDDDKRNSLFAKFYARVDVPFIKGLSYTINFGNNYRWARRFNSDEGDGAGTAFKMNSSAYDWTLDNILSYKTTIADKHNIDATFVYGARENEYEETMAQGIGFSNQELTYNSLEQAETFTATSDAWEESYVYQMGRLAYNYADKYYLTATLRRDGFSAFPDGNKTALFPSAALGWVVSEENFMRDSFANYLKLRLSYGANGNLINRYASSALVTSEAAYVDGSTSLIGQEARELANPNLVWESTTGFNYGIDFGIFNNLVSGSLEYYNTTTDDLIFGFVIPEATGFSSILSNIGEVKNTGFEASLNINPLRTDNFNWNLGIVFATNQNEITALPGQDNNDNGLVDVNAGSFNDQFLEIGESIGAIYNYEQDGFWQISDFQAGLIEDFQIGSERLVDQNGDGVIDTSDLVVVGRTEPAYQFSISNQFTYKQFDLSFLLNSVQGGQDGYLGEQNVWEGGIGTLSAAVLGNFYREINFWTPNNTNPDFRSPASFQEAANFRPWEDRSFVRLQDISLSYNLDSNLTDKLGMGNCRLYVSGKNLITWTDWNGWDPETNTGIALAGRPVMRSIALGLDISF